MIIQAAAINSLTGILGHGSGTIPFTHWIARIGQTNATNVSTAIYAAGKVRNIGCHKLAAIDPTNPAAKTTGAACRQDVIFRCLRDV